MYSTTNLITERMGNVQAAEAPPSSMSETPAAPAAAVDTNPGSMEDLHKKTKENAQL